MTTNKLYLGDSSEYCSFTILGCLVGKEGEISSSAERLGTTGEALGGDPKDCSKLVKRTLAKIHIQF